ILLQKSPTLSTLEGGTYEIIRGRRATQKEDLLERLHKLNESRKKIFAGIETQLMPNTRIITENNCIPSDVISIGDTCIFGYNVHFGLRTEIKTGGVFSIYRFEENEFKQQPLDLISDETFLTDFHNLYKYYRDTEFRKFFISGN